MKRKQTLGKNSTVPAMLLNVMKDPNNQSVDKITSFSPLTPVEFETALRAFAGLENAFRITLYSTNQILYK